MDVDPVASMQVWPVTVDCEGHEFTIPALPASQWLHPLMRMSEVGVLPGLLPVDQRRAWRHLMADGTINEGNIATFARDAIEAATGMTPWPAFMIAANARAGWATIGGKLIASGVEFDRISIGAALVAIHRTIIESIDKDNRDKYLRKLDNPPREYRTSVDRQQAMKTIEQEAGPRPTGEPAAASAAPSGQTRPKTRLSQRQRRQAEQSTAPTGRQ